MVDAGGVSTRMLLLCFESLDPVLRAIFFNLEYVTRRVRTKMCFAGTNAAIRSFVVDEEILIGSKGSELGVQSPDAVLFCGDTKGNIRCFVEFPNVGVDSASSHSKSSPEKTGSGNISRAGMRLPTLEMKHQHGKNQV